MQTLETEFKEGERRGPEALARLAQAYRNVFFNNSVDAQIVFADLLAYSGYYKVADYSVGALGLADHNARRAVLGRVLHFLRLTPEELAELEQAVRRGHIADKTEGTL